MAKGATVTVRPRAGRRPRTGRRLFVVFGLFAVVAFGASALLGEVAPSSTWGLGFGIAATVWLLVTAAYGARRRAPRLASRLGLGRASTWLSIHLWGGALFLLLVFMHSGFRTPTGHLTWGLWLLSIWIVGTGLIGLALQRWIPHLLSELETDVLFERIPELTDEVRERAERIAAGGHGSLRRVFDQRLAPAFARPRRTWRSVLVAAGGSRSQQRELAYVRQFLDEDELPALDELEALYRTKLEIDAHYTLQSLLRGWLVTHVPASIVLVGLVVVHVAVVMLY